MLFLSFSTVQAGQLGPRLLFITLHQNNHRLYKLPPGEKTPVSLLFRIPQQISTLERQLPAGVTLKRIEGRLLHTDRVVIAEIDLRTADFDQLRRLPDLVQVESLWRPQHILPLDIAREQVQAEKVWSMHDAQKQPLTGDGVIIADFDTGINHFHPAFFFADGDTFRWIDVNQNTKFDPGNDGVDLNHNGDMDKDEILNFIQVQSHLKNPPDYTPSLDWLYNDMNVNGKRDFGADQGFSEKQAAYGEPVFLVLDDNRNDRLDPDEQLVALSTSKICKIFQTDGEIRTRGIDLIKSEGDYYGHGTPVGGIILGGVPGYHTMAGIAPGAELILGNNTYIDDPPFILTMEMYAPWAAMNKAKVMLYEDGEWIWQYMDGSSALEIMMNELAAKGIIQVVPAGNLTGGGMQTSGTIESGQSMQVPFTVTTFNHQRHIWGDFLWLGDSTALHFSLQLPDSGIVLLTGTGKTISRNDIDIYSQQSRSWSGTNRFDFLLSSPTEALQGTFSFHVTNNSDATTRYVAYLWDDRSSWAGRTRWDHPTDDATVTWPSTADSAITVAAYNPRNERQSLNSFSGRGPRIDGRQIVDIAAPGSITYSTSASQITYYGGYTGFGGTSAAGPFVAGAVALLLQADSTLSSGDIRRMLYLGADQTGISENLPNNNWGYGRLRIADALNYHPTYVAERSAPGSHQLQLSVYPNPFNSTATLHFQIPVSDRVCVTIYNVLGRCVRTLLNAPRLPGNYSLSWDGLTDFHHPASSGVYFISIETSHLREVKKVTLLR